MNALHKLAERCGIERSFLDAKGKMQRISEQTMRALLAAMGIQVNGEANAKAALQELERAEWNQPLPPVCVSRRKDSQQQEHSRAERRPNANIGIDVTLPAGASAARWQLALENGERYSGEAKFAELELVAAHGRGRKRRERRRLNLVESIPLGYHQLTIEPGAAITTLIVAPAKCSLPCGIADGRRYWGVSAQLYLLRSQCNWGIGDYGDLGRLMEIMAAHRADIVGLNPLHALFIDDPEHASPYSPNSRLLLNVLNIDVAALLALHKCAEAQELTASQQFSSDLQQCRANSLVDYSRVTALKLKAFRLIFATARSNRESPRWKAFEDFRRKCSHDFLRSCLFQALREFFAEQDPQHANWHNWPKPYQDPSSPAVSQFAQEHEELVAFHTWLQFVADEQLRSAAEAASKMAVGIYRDLAVGADPCGADAWSNQAALVQGADVGAPPDAFNPTGQNWGLPPTNPQVLRHEAYRSFISVIRENMRHAGALRIDHAMALQHLYWVPKGMSPSEGAYVRSPMDDLFAVLALESHRNHCLIIAEDLGTVPQGFRERIAEENILSYRVLFFEKGERGFLPPDRYPALAVAVASNHDLPTLRAWWQASDIDRKEKRNLFPNAQEAEHAREERRRDKADLINAFRDAGLTSGDENLGSEQVVSAAHAYLARTKSALALAQIDDITGETDPVNIPATSDRSGNWRRRISVTLEQLASDPRLAEVAASFQAERAPHEQALAKNTAE